jgi:hypothetical protein
MVGHDYEFIQSHFRKPLRQAMPLCLDNLTQLSEPFKVVTTIKGAQRQEICALPRIIVILQPNGSTVMNVWIVSVHFFTRETMRYRSCSFMGPSRVPWFTGLRLRLYLVLRQKKKQASRFEQKNIAKAACPSPFVSLQAKQLFWENELIEYRSAASTKKVGGAGN